MRQIHEHAPSDADLCRESCPLAAQWVLDDLHHEALPLEQQLFNGGRGDAQCAFCSVFTDICNVHEGCALKTDLNERTLHAWQHPNDFA